MKRFFLTVKCPLDDGSCKKCSTGMHQPIAEAGTKDPEMVEKARQTLRSRLAMHISAVHNLQWQEAMDLVVGCDIGQWVDESQSASTHRSRSPPRRTIHESTDPHDVLLSIQVNTESLVSCMATDDLVNLDIATRKELRTRRTRRPQDES
jgi:hypothetical protein